MLTETEREFVELLLSELVRSMPSPRQAIASVLGDLAGRLGDGLVPDLLVSEAVTICIADGYRRAPPALVLLLELVKNIEGVPEIITRLRTPPPPAPDPFSALILDNKRPFLDRMSVRTYLRAFTKPIPMQPVVVVVGDTKSGKSHTSEFIDHLYRCLFQGPDTFEPCRVSVEKDTGKFIGPAELARDLVTKMGGDPQREPPIHTVLDRWAQELANWVIAEANKSKLRWWFILDGFNKDELREDARLLIVKLANNLTTGLARRMHRLILLDFDRTHLSLQPGMIAVESTAGIPSTAVAAGISELVKAVGQTHDETKLLAKVLKGFPDPVMDLPELELRFQDLMKEITA